MEVRGESTLSEAECWSRLGSVSIGRLALSVHALPTVLPVQYYVDGDELAICLGHYRVDAKAIDDVVVAFAADVIDTATRSGWIVNVQGTSRLRTELGIPVDCGQPAGGQVIHLSPATIAGQLVQLCPFL
jgi:hypothetical protein